MNICNLIFDPNNPRSFSSSFRAKRFSLFATLLNPVDFPIHILDVGGTIEFWRQAGLLGIDGIIITLFNVEHHTSNIKNVIFVKGDGRDLSVYNNKQFDIVFSNSTIEHVGAYDQQKKMASEIMRVGKRIFVQTPNRNFPIEPHFFIPYFQFFPFYFRAFLLRHFSLGWFSKGFSLAQAKEIIESINLLSKKQFHNLFPGTLIYSEKIAFLNKSYIVYK